MLTRSGTLSLTAPSICSRIRAIASCTVASSSGHSKISSSCTWSSIFIRSDRPLASSRACRQTIAAFTMSAALPWIGVFTATRSAACCSLLFRLLMPRICRRRPMIVVEKPLALASATVLSMNLRTSA